MSLLTGGIIAGNAIAWLSHVVIGVAASITSSAFVLTALAYIRKLSIQIDEKRKEKKRKVDFERDSIKLVTEFIIEYNRILLATSNRDLVHMDAQICILILCIFGVEYDIVKHTLDKNSHIIDPARPAHPITLHPFLLMVVKSIKQPQAIEVSTIQKRLIHHDVLFRYMYTQQGRSPQRYLREYLIARLYQNELARLDMSNISDVKSHILDVVNTYPLNFNHVDVVPLLENAMDRIQALQTNEQFKMKEVYATDSLSVLKQLGFESQYDFQERMREEIRASRRVAARQTARLPEIVDGPGHQYLYGVPSASIPGTPGDGGASKTVAELRRYAKKHKINLHGATKKAEIVAHIRGK